MSSHKEVQQKNGSPENTPTDQKSSVDGGRAISRVKTRRMSTKDVDLNPTTAIV